MSRDRSLCENCHTTCQKLRRTFEGHEPCADTNCISDEFIVAARRKLARSYVGEYAFFEHIVADPLDVAVLAAGDLLGKNGAMRLDEMERFLEYDRTNADGKGDEELVERWEKFVSVRLRRTIAIMHGEADPWSRKIRRSIEQVFWKEDNIARIHGCSQTLYHREADGDPLLEMDRMCFDDIVSGIFGRALQHDSIPELVMVVFDILSEKPDCCHALTVAELTQILRCYFERIYRAEPDKSIEEIPEVLDDRQQRQIDGILARIRNGRLVHYRESGVFCESECQSVLIAVEKYLVGLYQQCPRHPHEYLQEVFPGYQQRWKEESKRKRMSNLFHLARKIMKTERNERNP